MVEEVVVTDRVAKVYTLDVADFHTYFVDCEEWGFSVWAHNVCVYHYTDKSGANGINGSGVIKASVPGYSGHGITHAVVFVTPLDPASLLATGLSKAGLTRAKAEYVVSFDVPAKSIKRIPGGRGAYVWYIEGDVRLPRGVKAVLSGI